MKLIWELVKTSFRFYDTVKWTVIRTLWYHNYIEQEQNLDPKDENGASVKIFGQHRRQPLQVWKVLLFPQSFHS